ncbi:hypothetical protein [Peribacillus glennii]|uniref:Uncharacterized protein n=1 Tax=Peribacillus glennii TaxID=2303991 RepID=A0A372LGK1_9BACI|nr:hypothetical protein [Peribacillus glennii]RFU65417.1 hypothetical protein D0466_05865 [Peribacillus glennii]
MSSIRRFFTKKEPILQDVDKRINSIEQTLETIKTYFSQINDETASSLLKQFEDELKPALRRQIKDASKNGKKESVLNDVHNPPIIIEQLRVDQIVVQKLEYSNNFGQLGIQELKGKLNIGTSHEGEIKTDKTDKFMSKSHEKMAEIPEVKFQPRKE